MGTSQVRSLLRGLRHRGRVLVGGKNASLGEMIQNLSAQGVRVRTGSRSPRPPGHILDEQVPGNGCMPN